VGRLMPAVDQHHAVLCENDAGVGFEVLSDIGVDAVAELHELWAEILRKRGRARHTCGDCDQCCCGCCGPDGHEDPPDNWRSVTLRPSLTGIPDRVRRGTCALAARDLGG